MQRLQHDDCSVWSAGILLHQLQWYPFVWIYYNHHASEVTTTFRLQARTTLLSSMTILIATTSTKPTATLPILWRRSTFRLVSGNVSIVWMLNDQFVANLSSFNTILCFIFYRRLLQRWRGRWWFCVLRDLRYHRHGQHQRWRW